MEIARTLIARGARGDLEVADASPSRYTVLLQPSSSSDGVPRIDVLRIDGADIELLDSVRPNVVDCGADRSID